MNPKPVILFDNDGILVDTEPLWIEANVQTFAAVGHPITRDFYLDYNLTQGKGLVHYLPEQGFSPEQIQAACDARDDLYYKWVENGFELLPGVYDTLVKIKQSGQYQMGIVTAAEAQFFEPIHQHTGVLELMDFVVMNEDVVRTKPYPDPYLLGLEKAGVTADQAIVVEDSPRGVAAAAAAGITNIYAIPTEATANGDFTAAKKRLGFFGDLVGELLWNILTLKH